MSSFFLTEATDADHRGSITHCPADATNRRKACDAVSAVLRKSAATAELEALDRHIAWFAQLRDQAKARWERDGCFSAKGDMDRWELMRLEAVAKRGGL